MNEMEKMLLSGNTTQKNINGSLLEKERVTPIAESKNEYNEQKEQLLAYLEKKEIVVSKNPYVLDIDKFKNIVKSRIQIKQKFLNQDEIINALVGVKCISKADIESNKTEDSTLIIEKPLLNIPTNIEDVLKGNIANPGYLNPWEIQENTKWDIRIPLSEGKNTTLAEIFIAQKLNELGAHRNNMGDLEIIDPANNKPKKISGYLFQKLIKELGGKELRIRTTLPNEKEYQTGFGSRAFSEKVLPNLFSSGILKNEDFKTIGGSAVSELYAINERKLDPKSPYIGLSGKYGFTRYYLGRDKIVGTKTETNEFMSVIQLDPNTFGIVEKLPGRNSRLLYTFDGLNEQEIANLRSKTSANLLSKSIEPTEAKISAYSLTGGAEMKKRIREYKITELFPQKKDETSEVYATRLSNLSDTDYVLNNFREFFKDANIGVHNLSWIDQLSIANAILEEKNKKRLVSFASDYKLDGVRTFLSLEHGGKEMSDKILTLGEKLPRQNAELLFKKYGEIIDEVNNVAEYFSVSLAKNATPEIIEQTKEQLLIKGKEMLAYYADHAKTCAEQECVDLGTELETRLKDLKASVVLLGSAVKTLVERGEFNLQDLKDIEISYDEHGLQEKDKAAISAMSHENTKQYPEKLRDYWRGTAEQALEHPAPGETFISVKYQGEIVVVMRVIPQNDGSFYGASFNVNPNIRGSRIGTELMKEVIDNYTKQGDFVADCYEHNPMLENYTGKFGFEIIDTIENYHDTGATIKKIIRRKQAN